MTAPSETSITYTSGEKSYVGIHLAPDGPAAATVVLLPDWRGASALARTHAGRLVDLGYAVVIVDLYGDGFLPDSPDQVGPLVKELIENRGRGVAALQACIDALPEPGQVVLLGYSAGGMIALDYGRSGASVAGIITCSALLKTAGAGMATRIEAPVLILQGTQDEVAPMSVIDEVIAEMDSASNDFRLELYGQTHHAFDNPEAGTDPTARLVYSPQSARRAEQAIADFLTQHAR